MTSKVTCDRRVSAQPEDQELANDLPADSFALLLRAARYAQNARRSAWDFAVRFCRLREAGLNECDLRWLACKGYIEHALETSQPPGVHRTIDETLALRFSDRSSFVLTPQGMILARSLLAGATAMRAEIDESHVPAATQLAPGGVSTPVWDWQRRELRMGRIVIKRFCVPAENQETILSAFEEEAWPVHIDDPLPPAPEIDPKRRLHSTIQCLNRNQQVQLVHFHGDGYGRGVRWALLSA